jgi:phenylacetyl-CoA:acceptor oxidoreductase
MKKKSKQDYNIQKEEKEDIWIPALCEGYCADNPCAVRVHRVDGVAVNIEPNTEGENFQQLSKGHGKLCAKPFGNIQKIYNPHRIKGPLKRTNSEKGIGVDPKWVNISWAEALDTIAEKLKEIRAKDSNRLSHGGPGLGGLFACLAWYCFFLSYGHTRELFGGRGTRCEEGEHTFAQRIHGAFQCEPDLDYCEYLIIIGNNTSATGGATEGTLFADARERGMKIIVVDPVLSPTAAKADEWLPIKPGTDTAFLLAIIHVIIIELARYDEMFLKQKTNSPYLVKPDGYFLRDKKTGKVLIWDTEDRKAKTYDDPSIVDFALEGTYEIEGIKSEPAFQALKDHVKQYTPEWAASITDIPSENIRRIASEFVDNAKIGSTIEIDGITFPYRPVATKLGRGVSGTMHSYPAVLANHILAGLVGSIEVPGGHMGGHTNRDGRIKDGVWFYGLEFDWGIQEGKDGMPRSYHLPFIWPPKNYGGSEVFVPMTGEEPLSGVPPANADPYMDFFFQLDHLNWRNLVDPPKNFPVPPPPEMWIGYRTNPLLALGKKDLVAQAMKKIPFIFTISYTLDEVAEFADIVLPEEVELERYVLYFRTRSVSQKKYFQLMLQQPVIEKMHDTWNANDIFIELAHRLGFLDRMNKTLNGFLCLKEPYTLKTDRKYSWEEIVDKQCLSYTNGVHNLDWFKKNGGIAKQVSVEDQYDIYEVMKEKKLRYSVPYMEDVKKAGEELESNLKKVGIDWWPTDEYVPLPTYFPQPIEEIPPEYNFYVTNCRLATFGWGNNPDIPWMNELSEHIKGSNRIIMNADAAKDRGIKNEDEIWIESPFGKVRQQVCLIQGIRPDVVLISGQFGQWAMPVAKEKGRVTISDLLPVDYKWTDKVTGTQQGQLIKAKVYRAKNRGKAGSR